MYLWYGTGISELQSPIDMGQVRRASVVWYHNCDDAGSLAPINVIFFFSHDLLINTHLGNKQKYKYVPM